MKPFRVLIKLSSAMVVPRQPLHLDALLSALRVARDEDKPGFDPSLIKDDIPLDRYHSPSGEWCFKGSAFRLIRHAPSFMWMLTGRADLPAIAEDRHSGFLRLRQNEVSTAGGPFKSTKTDLEVVLADVEAFGVGDIDAVRDMLSECKQIGARRGIAFGNIASVHIEEVAEQECRWQWRVLPFDANTRELDVEASYAIAGLRAPYWDRLTHVKVAIPVDL